MVESKSQQVSEGNQVAMTSGGENLTITVNIVLMVVEPLRIQRRPGKPTEMTDDAYFRRRSFHLGNTRGHTKIFHDLSDY